MTLVRWIYGPKVGKQLRPDLPLGHEDIRPEDASANVANGFCEIIKYKNHIERLTSLAKMQSTPVAHVRWQSIKDDIKGRFAIVAKCDQANCTSVCFHGDPKIADTLVFYHSCGCGSTERVTKEVVAAYRKNFQPVTTLSAEEAIYWRNHAPTHDPHVPTAEEILQSNLARGATSESALARQGGFSPDRPYLTPQEILAVNVKNGAK
jgi:hypothetical protein